MTMKTPHERKRYWNEPELTTQEDRTAAQQVVSGYGAGEEPGMVMPYGWKTEVQEGRMNEHALLNAINFHRTQIHCN